MSKSLPDRPSLDHLKNEAKRLLKAHRQGDRSVCETLRLAPRFFGVSDEGILAAAISLQEMQHALALSYGYSSWKNLRDEVLQRSSFPSVPNDLVLVFRTPHAEPAAHALVAAHVRISDEPRMGSKMEWTPTSSGKLIRANARGEAILSLTDLFSEGWSKWPSRVFYVLDPERRFGTFLDISRQDFGRRIGYVLQPVCLVQGKIASRSLEQLGRPLQWANTMIGIDRHRPLQYESKHLQFEFYLPPGHYTLSAYGIGKDNTPTEHLHLPLDVTSGVPQMDLGTLELPASPLARLLGKPAPELQVRQWRNGGPVTMAGLRGKLVLLSFGAANDLPQLVEWHRKYKDLGLAVIALFQASSFAQVEMGFNTIKGTATRFGESCDFGEVPFLLGLDGEPAATAPDHGGMAGATTNAYGIQAWPTTLLIDPNGVLVESVFVNKAGEKVLAERLGVDVDLIQPPWRQRFKAVYSLAPDQLVKHIAPPFIPERMQFVQEQGHFEGQAGLEPHAVYSFHWKDADLIPGGTLCGQPTLERVLEFALGLGSYQVEGPDAWLKEKLPGDWIIRAEALVDLKVQALAAILQQKLHWPIRFEKQTMDRQVVIARGEFDLDSLPDRNLQPKVRIYSDPVPDEIVGGGGDDLTNFFRKLGNLIGREVVDQTDSAVIPYFGYAFHRSGCLHQNCGRNIPPEKLNALLSHVTRQTSLAFQLETCPCEVWVVKES